MTDIVEAAVGEINRVAAWALRGMGMAFGVADRAAPLVGWAEAVEGGALKELRVNTPYFDGPRPTDWHSRKSDAAWTFDASSRSLLEVGPVAVDLLTLAARTGQIGRVDLVNLVDPVFLSGVMRIAAKRQVGLVALSPDGDLGLCGMPVAMLHAFPGPEQPMFDEGGLPASSAIDDAVAACLERQAPSGEAGIAISLMSYSPAAPVQHASAPSRFDAEQKHVLAQSNGVPVEREDLTHLYGLELRTWAPTSERSRNQALA